MFDIIIKGGKILDGAGNPYYLADIGIKGGAIVKIAKGLTGAKRVIDAKGLTVTPGFIDSHSHSDAQIITFPDQKEKVEQGITTSIGGMCGGSIVPRPSSDEFYRTVGEFMEHTKELKLGANIAIAVGHGNIRGAVLGNSDKDPTPEELEKMKAILREAMENGAIGMSLGLI
jgi:N-acyl-D-aspartate/D-glutamate deacylase